MLVLNNGRKITIVRNGFKTVVFSGTNDYKPTRWLINFVKKHPSLSVVVNAPKRAALKEPVTEAPVESTDEPVVSEERAQKATTKSKKRKARKEGQ